MQHPRTAHVGAVGEGWALQTLAAAGIGTARPSADLDGIDLIAWFIEDDRFCGAPLQIKTTTDGNVTIYRTKYPDYIGMLYVLLTDDLTVDRAFLLPQVEAREIGQRHFGDTASWSTTHNYYRGPFSRVAEDFEGFELTATTARRRLVDVIDPPTCTGSVGP